MNNDDEIQRLESLKNVARAIVDFVQAGAKGSEFRRDDSGWTLEPDNWVSLNFTYTRKFHIHVSLGVHASAMDNIADLPVRPGRRSLSLSEIDPTPPCKT